MHTAVADASTLEAPAELFSLARAESLVATLQVELSAAGNATESPPSLDSSTAKIMIVDDEPINVKVVRKYLKDAGFRRFVEVSNSAEVVQTIRAEAPDVLLLDILMPEVSGLDVLREIRGNPQTVALPVVILSAVEEREVKATALELGASDFLSKPVDSTELVPRVRNALAVKAYHDHLKHYAEQLEREVRQRTAELAASRLEVIHCLARAAEYRDNDTGLHVVRVGRYAGLIARALGLDATLAELIETAAPLHDVGKIGIPDAVLLKPGKLDAQEFEIIRQHCQFGWTIVTNGVQDARKKVHSHASLGAKIMSGAGSPELRMAASIAMSHHEKWDGSGYPMGLRGEAIPLEGRITAVADVFDAVASKRPYKPALPVDRCFQVLEEGRGTHFDPRVLDAFVASQDEVLEIYCQYFDPPDTWNELLPPRQ